MTVSFHTLGLSPELIQAVEEEGYETPTPIQEQAIPLALAGRDVVGSAQTGTGKTAAFLLPILQRLGGRPRGKVRALVLVPTRELAEQVLESARTYGRHTGLEAAAVYGGVGMEQQTQALRRGVAIVIATPGRLLDHIGRGHFDPSELEVLVLDEADRMLDMGFAPDVNRILETLPERRQTLLFSATISADVDRLARRALQQHAAVEIGRRAQAADGVAHMLVAVDKTVKRDLLARMLTEITEGRILVFTRTKYGADRLTRHLRHEGHDAIALHGDKTQGARNAALDGFRDGTTRVLVATDLAARGVDVDDIAIVVNYDVPADPEVYVHRVGRTARAGARGLALTLMSPDEWLLMVDIEKLIGRALLRETVPGFEPTMAPIQPREQAAVRPSGPSVRPRLGRGRR
ncbi:MAG TPA: DEAD/DEAH box helicase [Gemmatimonadales bacterium]|nr:DEAD/DEAH box helicase [Gemmatimonadales bacterium]